LDTVVSHRRIQAVDRNEMIAAAVAQRRVLPTIAPERIETESIGANDRFGGRRGPRPGHIEQLVVRRREQLFPATRRGVFE